VVRQLRTVYARRAVNSVFADLIRDKLNALFRRAASLVMDVRDPIQVAHNQIAAWAVELETRAGL
jgi:hypothetical protein